MEKLYFPEYEGFLKNKEDDEIREFVEDSQCDSTKRKIGYWVDNLNMFAVNSGLHYPDILSKEGLNPVDWSPVQRYNTRQNNVDVHRWSSSYKRHIHLQHHHSERQRVEQVDAVEDRVVFSNINKGN